ncbi:MAG TPA: outer membrane lipoprotein-sorting protein [Polyangiaceae bacterium]
MTGRIRVLFVLLLTLWVAAPAHAADTLTGEQIAARILKTGIFDAEAGRFRVTMVLVSKDGIQRERDLEILARTKNGLVQSVVRVRNPADVAGTAFLVLDKKNGPPEQYIYLPRLDRTRRITGRDRRQPFLSSDFTYSDLRRVEPQHATHRRLPDDKIGTDPVYVVESKPKAALRGAYSRVETWVRKSDYLPLRTRFYDLQGRLAKTLYARRVQMQDGKPFVKEARMQTHETGHATLLVIESAERRAALPDTAFTPTALEHP